MRYREKMETLPPAEMDEMRSAVQDALEMPYALKTSLKTFLCGHRVELLEALPAAEVDEMRSAVQSALEAVAGPGWRLIPVGGGARDIRSHDCDFVITHDSNKCGCQQCWDNVTLISARCLQ